METVTVREAQTADLEEILALYKELAEDRPESMPASASAAVPLLEKIIFQPGRTLLVGLVDEAVVGTADVVIVSNLTHGGMPWAVVENVIVGHQRRLAGVGRALMQEVIRRCRESDCYKIQLLSRKHRQGAHAFYARLGFEPTAEGFRLYLD